MKGPALSAREERRLQALDQVLEKRLPLKEGAALPGVSERHAWRLLAAYHKEGAAPHCPLVTGDASLPTQSVRRGRCECAIWLRALQG